MVTLSNYAYIDIYKTKRKYASECTQYDVGRVFYCPFENCTAHLFVCGLMSDKRNNYFSANDNKYPHIEDCIYSMKGFNFNRTEYNEENFIFQNAIESLMVNSKQSISNNKNANYGNGNVRVLRTLKQIYTMCKNIDINDTYNEIEIWQMLVDSRSIHMYENGILGYKIIECSYYCYNSENNTILVKCPDRNNNKYILGLHFSNCELFRKTLNKIFDKDSNRHIIIGGNFKEIENKISKYNIFSNFGCEIYSKKQVAIFSESQENNR